ncbi:hypothetical protein [Burkholderia pseudomallei]|uniref:hypothetical protein n=1 Tax=Burkholderia pseudomallei TaxID=28450 RepID=UPI001E5D2C9E|nr:hypothetical protein [Burkholderia pseudomallei]
MSVRPVVSSATAGAAGRPANGFTRRYCWPTSHAPIALRIRRAVSRLRSDSGPTNGRHAGSNRSTRPRPIQRAAGCGSRRKASRYSAQSSVFSDDSGLPFTTIAHSSSRSASRRYARRVASLRAPRIEIHA